MEIGAYLLKPMKYIRNSFPVSWFNWALQLGMEFQRTSLTKINILSCINEPVTFVWDPD